EAAVAVEHGSGRRAAGGGGDGGLYLGHVEAVARGLFAVDLHGQHRQAGSLLDLDAGGAVHAAQHRGDLGRAAVQHVHVVTEQFDRDVAAHAGNEFVEAQLDRL